jgi:hypothetical protein
MAMTRFLLAIGAGLLSAHVAYAQTTLPHCSKQCSDISNLVCPLTPNYNPNSTNTPTCDTSVSVPAGTVTKINNAFLAGNNNTVRGLQKCLCSLKQIFVIPANANSDSWGKWLNPHRTEQEYSRTTGSDDSYVALNVNDLDTTVSKQQDAHLAGLQIAAGVASHSESNNSNIDSGTLAVLYALAHEMAHMSWRRDNGSFNANCNLVKMANSWVDAAKAPSYAKRMWTTFGQTSFGQRNATVLPNPVGASAAALQTIYKGSVVTALGAANPEEDFVESYAVETINRATVNKFTLNINIVMGGNTVTLPVNVNRNSDVQFKFGCVDMVVAQ